MSNKSIIPSAESPNLSLLHTEDFKLTKQEVIDLIIDDIEQELTSKCEKAEKEQKDSEEALNKFFKEYTECEFDDLDKAIKAMPALGFSQENIKIAKKFSALLNDSQALELQNSKASLKKKFCTTYNTDEDAYKNVLVTFLIEFDSRPGTSRSGTYFSATIRQVPEPNSPFGGLRKEQVECFAKARAARLELNKFMSSKKSMKNTIIKNIISSCKNGKELINNISAVKDSFRKRIEEVNS